MFVGASSRIGIGYKLFFSLLGLSAILTEIIVLIHRGTFSAGNFFSFFTIQSNMMAVAAFLLGAYYAARRIENARFNIFRGAVTLYMATTGIIFAIMLSGLDPRVLTAVPWDNTVLHYIMPIAVIADWLVNPPKQRLGSYAGWLWLVYPVVYLIYTLARGFVTDWYPYPFLNVVNNGYAPVLLACAGVALVVSCLSWFIVLFGRRMTRR